MCFGGGGGGDKYAALARRDQQEREARVRQGMDKINSQFKGFNQGFYNQQAKAYEDYANPQLENQFSKSKENLSYNLARAGLTASSEAARNAGELQRQYNLGRSTIANEGLNVANRARQDVEQNRSELISQLNATGDARAAASGALSRAGYLTSQQGFSPIGNLFEQGSALLGNAAAAGYYDRNARGLGAYGITQPGRTPAASRVIR